MTYTPLPIKTKDVAELRLDLDNYRIPVRPDDEASALKFLVASEDVLTLVRELLRDGYFDNEVPIVVEETFTPQPTKKQKAPKPVTAPVVLEGNRRVSALKLIQDPTLVPEHETEMRALLTRYAREVADMPDAIRVIIAPSRAAASPHIGRLHTGQSKKRWNLDQQAKFYHSLLGPAVGLDEIKNMYPGATRVQRLLRMAEMREFLTGVKFKDASLKEYVRSDELAMSAFEYAYKPADIAEAIGVVFDGYQIKPTKKSASAIGSGLTATQRNAVEILMNGFRAGVFNTRSAEFKKGSDEKNALLDALRGKRPSSGGASGSGAGGDGTGAGSGTGGGAGAGGSGGAAGGGGSAGGGDDGSADGSTGAGSGSDSGGGSTGGARGPDDPTTSRGLPIGGFDLSSAPSNLKHRYIELRKIDVERTPAAAAMLLRSVIEATTKEHFAGTADHVNGELGKCLEAVERVYGSQRLYKNAISKARSGRTADVGSLAWFNAAAHDANFPIVESEVRIAFRVVESLLQLLLKDYKS